MGREITVPPGRCRDPFFACSLRCTGTVARDGVLGVQSSSRRHGTGSASKPERHTTSQLLTCSPPSCNAVMSCWRRERGAHHLALFAVGNLEGLSQQAELLSMALRHGICAAPLLAKQGGATRGLQGTHVWVKCTAAEGARAAAESAACRMRCRHGHPGMQADEICTTQSSPVP